MKLSEVKQVLEGVEEVVFRLPDGTRIPEHFHVTEVGAIEKKFIDCGGTIRSEHRINFQLWYSIDKEHRLSPEKLAHIISLAEEQLELRDGEVEVEYQGETIGKYNLEFKNGEFQLRTTLTNCLAPNQCGIPREKKPRIRLKAKSSSAGVTKSEK